MTSTPSKPSRRIGVYGGVAGLVLIALIAAFVLSSKDPGGTDMPANASVTVTGESLPLFAGDPNSDPGVGLVAPDLTGENFGGVEIDITADGRPKVILFLAHWCPHCQREVPTVQSYADETGFPDTVDIYSVATSYNEAQPNWPPSAWLEREGWTFPVIVDDPASSAYQAFGQGAFPYYVFIDSTGTVALRLSGEQDPAFLADVLTQLGGI